MVGASFRPGAAPSILGIPADELRDLRVPLSEVWGSEAVRGEPRRSRVTLRPAATDRRRAAAPPDRQLLRRFHAAVGYGPKTFARVLRFQRMLALARQRRSRDLGWLALDAGYADQAHMTAECTRLGGAPPARLLATL